MGSCCCFLTFFSFPLPFCIPFCCALVYIKALVFPDAVLFPAIHDLHARPFNSLHARRVHIRARHTTVNELAGGGNKKIETFFLWEEKEEEEKNECAGERLREEASSISWGCRTPYGPRTLSCPPALHLSRASHLQTLPTAPQRTTTIQRSPSRVIFLIFGFGAKFR